MIYYEFISTINVSIINHYLNYKHYSTMKKTSKNKYKHINNEITENPIICLNLLYDPKNDQKERELKMLLRKQ